jgi:F1F0 ATPase subunit 2
MLEAPWAPISGFMLGLLFYGGLWWTVRHAASFRRPALTVLGSALLRMAIVLGGFYAVAGADGWRLMLCLAGFLVARLAVTWATRLPAQPPTPGPAPTPRASTPAEARRAP